MAAMDVLIQSVLKNLPPELQLNIVQAVEFLSKVQTQLDRVERNQESILRALHGTGQRGNGVVAAQGESRPHAQLVDHVRDAAVQPGDEPTDNEKPGG